MALKILLFGKYFNLWTEIYPSLADCTDLEMLKYSFRLIFYNIYIFYYQINIYINFFWSSIFFNISKGLDFN